jgi:hypothetical protein
MKATDYEYHHQRLVHLFIVSAAILTYLIWPDDIVWQFVKNSAAPHERERAVFIVAMLLIAAGAILCTWARAFYRLAGATHAGPHCYLRHPRYLGDFLYSFGLGSLVPLWGFVILVVGEALRLYRLIRRENLARQPSAILQPLKPDPEWGKAFRQEAVKWGLVVTMILFVVTLKDRLADILVIASFLLGLLVNAPFFRSSSSTDLPN